VAVGPTSNPFLERRPADDAFERHVVGVLTIMLVEGDLLSSIRSMCAAVQSAITSRVLESKSSIAGGADVLASMVALECLLDAIHHDSESTTSYRVTIPAPPTSADDLTRIAIKAIPAEQRLDLVRGIYEEVRRRALHRQTSCVDDDIDSWPALWGARLVFMLHEQVVFRRFAAARGGKPTPDMRVFSDDEYQVLSKTDAELEETLADIMVAMKFYATDEAQEQLRNRIFDIAGSVGRLEARTALRDARQAHQVAPWNFRDWDARLSARS
jgi:hypothetical protein